MSNTTPIAALLPDHPHVELVDSWLEIHELVVRGPIVEVARSAKPLVALDGLVLRALDIGGAMLLHGQSQATVEAIAAEIDRLVGQTESATEALPTAMQEQLNEHLTELRGVLSERFDGTRTTSVQNQISTMV